MARFHIKIKQLRGQNNTDNVIQADNKLFWKIHSEHISSAPQCCSDTSLLKRNSSFSANNLKSSSHMKTQIPLSQISSGRGVLTAGLETKLLLPYVCILSFVLRKFQRERPQKPIPHSSESFPPPALGMTIQKPCYNQEPHKLIQQHWRTDLQPHTLLSHQPGCPQEHRGNAIQSDHTALC